MHYKKIPYKKIPYKKIIDILYKFKYHILFHSIILISSILILVIGVETNYFNWTDSNKIQRYINDKRIQNYISSRI